MVDPDIVKSIFLTAIEKLPAERAAYLHQAAGGDAELHARVAALLKAHDDSGTFLEPQPAMAETANVGNIQESAGSIIGPYKLLQQIGEGGMGVVFMAEQMRPVQRTVALKIIKPGMDSRQVIARFEAERQALAMMDHPNIAHVLDAGTTDTGRPYFVMDLVKGVPITEYCDQQHLPVRQRLELMGAVCQAVQHAHQKGIIHRDIKPTNVLVAEYDGKPVPKIIDFGVAKATAHKLTEKTMFTEYGQLIGTFEYMSPEQARFNQLDIDTRSDIYSLGVLLYELLTGDTPFDRQRLRSAAFDEVLRIIREEEPPLPSTRLSTSDALPSIAANRNLEPKKLSGMVRGELDWIVMKCLDKNRNRRYETASVLARDLGRYLNDEAIEACPPSAAYRFRKFASRNKAALFIASSVVAILLVMVTVLAISNRMIAAQRERAEASFGRAHLAVRDILGQAALGTGSWADYPAPVRAQIAQQAIKFYEGFLQEENADPSQQFESGVSYRALGELYRSISDWRSAEKFLRRSVSVLQPLTDQHSTVVPYRTQLAYSRTVLGQVLRQLGRPSDAKPELEQAAVLYEQLISQRPIVFDCFNELPICYRELAIVQSTLGLTSDVDKTTRRLLYLSAMVPPESVDAATIHLRIAGALSPIGKSDEALHECDKVIELSPGSAAAYLTQGNILSSKGQLEEAVVSYNKAIVLQPDLTEAYLKLAAVLADQGKFAESVDANRKAIELNPSKRSAFANLADSLLQLGKIDEAVDELQKSAELEPKDFAAYAALGTAMDKLGRTDEADFFWRHAISRAPAAVHWNNLASKLLTTGPAKLRDPVAALPLAELAVHLSGGANAEIIHTLAQAYVDNGEFAKGALIEQKAINLLGPAAPNRNTHIQHLEQYKSRLTELADKAATQESTLGRESSDVLRSMRQVAVSRQLAGEMDASISQLDTIRKLQQSMLGDDHPDTIATTYSLIEAYVDAKRFADAETELSRIPVTVVKEKAFSTATLLLAVAQWHGGGKRWKQAARLYDELVFGSAKSGFNRDPTAFAACYLEYSSLLVELGDRAKYEQLRESAISYYGEIPHWGAANRLSTACQLLPPNLRQLDTFDKWAETCAQVSPQAGYRFWYYLTLALHDFRRGNNRRVLEWAQKALDAAPIDPCEARAHVFKAMALTRLGELASARAELTQGRETIENRLAGDLSVVTRQSGNWSDWLIDGLLLREADKLLASSSGDAPTSPPPGEALRN